MEELRAERLKHATVQDIDAELEELRPSKDGAVTDVDAEEKRLLALRRRRLEDLAREQQRGRFGRVYPIARQDYTREVTDASKQNADGQQGDDDDQEREDGSNGMRAPPLVKDQHGTERPASKGTGVVCFLYKDGLEECKLVSGYLDILAIKYPATKFVSIVGDKCIPNYPDRNLPTLLIYRNGELRRQIVGLRPEIGLDGMKTELGDIELLLLAVGAVEQSTVPGTENYGGLKSQADAGRDQDDDGEDEDEGFGGNRMKVKPSIRKTQEEEDAELDWDL